MIRKRKKFEWPRKLYDKPRILEENKLVSKYGLKNKKEIWKTEAKINYLRFRAKNLGGSSQEEQEKFIQKLNQLGLKIKNIAEALSLDKEDLLKRRLPSIVVKRGLATKPKQARQMVTHKRILVGDRVVNIPSYLVRVDEENLISLKKIKKTIEIESSKKTQVVENKNVNSEKNLGVSVNA